MSKELRQEFEKQTNNYLFEFKGHGQTLMWWKLYCKWLETRIDQSTGWISVEDKIQQKLAWIDSLTVDEFRVLKENTKGWKKPTPPQEDTEREGGLDWAHNKSDGYERPTQQPQESKGVEDEAMKKDLMLALRKRFNTNRPFEDIAEWALHEFLISYMSDFHHHMNQKREEGMEQRATKMLEEKSRLSIHAMNDDHLHLNPYDAINFAIQFTKQELKE